MLLRKRGNRARGIKTPVEHEEMRKKSSENTSKLLRPDEERNNTRG